MTEFYQPSNRYTLGGVLLFVLGGSVAAAILALAYVYATWYIPLIYANLLATLAFGFLMGLVLSRFVKSGKLRAPGLVAGLSLLVGLVAEYAQWGIYLSLVVNTTDVNEFGSGLRKMSVASTSFDPTVVLSILSQPGTIFSAAAQLAENGSWSVAGLQVSGIMLWLVWLVEAAIIIGLPLLMASGETKAPFSETANEWAAEEIMPRVSGYVTDAEQAKAAVRSGDFAPAGPGDDVATQFSRLKLHAAPNDTHCVYATLQQVRIEVDNKGKESEKTTDVFEYLTLTPAAYQALREKFTAPMPALAPTPAAGASAEPVTAS